MLQTNVISTIKQLINAVSRRDRQRERERERERQIRMIYSEFRPLPLVKGCGWMTYHLTVHTIIVPMSKKTNKLTTIYLTPY